MVPDFQPLSLSVAHFEDDAIHLDGASIAPMLCAYIFDLVSSLTLLFNTLIGKGRLTNCSTFNRLFRRHSRNVFLSQKLQTLREVTPY